MADGGASEARYMVYGALELLAGLEDSVADDEDDIRARQERVLKK